MSKLKIETGSIVAAPEYKVVILDKGPYLVYGQPPLAAQHITPNEVGESWRFDEGKSFPTDKEPTSLCRCGASKNKPYCDGTHQSHKWKAKLSARPEALLDNVEITSGDELTLTDNQQYCVFARFCDAGGGVWAATETSYDDSARRQAIRQASMCPSGRLMIWGNNSDLPFERQYRPSLGLIEDDALHVSGGLWVRGGIRIEREDGVYYEVRNRTVLCRCGESANKPYCDGSHASLHWRDELEKEVALTDNMM
jgi:CDGSH-type Zn-finger protein